MLHRESVPDARLRHESGDQSAALHSRRQVKMAHTICLLPGDGIGPEVTTATRQVIEASGVDIEWVSLPVGSTALEFCGSILPQRTLAAIAGHGVALKGPVTTPIGGGHASVNVTLRK